MVDVLHLWVGWHSYDRENRNTCTSSRGNSVSCRTSSAMVGLSQWKTSQTASPLKRCGLTSRGTNQTQLPTQVSFHFTFIQNHHSSSGALSHIDILAWYTCTLWLAVLLLLSLVSSVVLYSPGIVLLLWARLCLLCLCICFVFLGGLCFFVNILVSA